MQNNRINWFEIPVSDIARATAFYESIFGFKLAAMDIGDQVKMAVFPSDNESVGGALVENKEFYHPSEKGALLYLNANPNLAEVEARVEKAGGEVIISKRMISPDHGFMAVIRDTEGNRIALHSDK